MEGRDTVNKRNTNIDKESAENLTDIPAATSLSALHT